MAKANYKASPDARQQKIRSTYSYLLMGGALRSYHMAKAAAAGKSKDSWLFSQSVHFKHKCFDGCVATAIIKIQSFLSRKSV